MRYLIIAVVLCMMLTALYTQAAGVDKKLKQKIGQMVMVGFRGFELSGDMTVAEDIEERNLGGVILFDYDVPRGIPERNIRSLDQVRRLNRDLQARAETPLLIAVDQEGGNVARLKPEHGFQEMPSHHELGRKDDVSHTADVSAKAAGELTKLGFNLNFAPVVDVNINPENPIIGNLDRSFSGDPAVVTRHAEAFINNHREQDIFPVIKHFPGHGSSQDDSHLGLTDVTDTWKEAELQPYRELINSGSLRFIMTAHIFNEQLDPEHPSTLSHATLTGMLREQMGYDGLIVSDDMQMQAITDHYGLEEALELGINAGLDILVFGNNSVYEEDIAERAIHHILTMVEKGRISRSRIEESYNRIMELKQQL